MEEGASKERQTRSGRKLSGAGIGAKRRRSIGEEAEPTSKRMANEEDEDNRPISAQLADLRKFLGNKIDEGQKKADDNVAALTKRMDKSDLSMKEHKQKTKATFDALQSSLDAVALRVGMGNGAGDGTSYAATAGRAPSSSRPLRPFDSQSNQYWISRQSARVSPIEGDGEDEIWANLQSFFFDKMGIPRTELREYTV